VYLRPGLSRRGDLLCYAAVFAADKADVAGASGARRGSAWFDAAAIEALGQPVLLRVPGIVDGTIWRQSGNGHTQLRSHGDYNPVPAKRTTMVQAGS